MDANKTCDMGDIPHPKATAPAIASPKAADLPRPLAAVNATVLLRVFSEMASINFRTALAWWSEKYKKQKFALTKLFSALLRPTANATWIFLSMGGRKKKNKMRQLNIKPQTNNMKEASWPTEFLNLIRVKHRLTISTAQLLLPCQWTLNTFRKTGRGTLLGSYQRRKMNVTRPTVKKL